jgi:dTDP-4-amino-4,6-dideoxygalactose transaminase
MFGDYRKSLSELIAERYSISTCFEISSGRAALCLILNAMKDISPSHKTEVILPSYTCYSLPACVIRCGLKVKVVDVDPTTLRMQRDDLRDQDLTNVLAVIPTSLYGIPEEYDKIEDALRSSSVFLIDDAAQAMDATLGDRFLGSFGDAGVFSFDKGKTLTSIQGGIAVANSEVLRDSMQRRWQELPRAPLFISLNHAAQTLGYGLLLNPLLYALPAALPFLALGQTQYSEVFTITQYPRFQQRLAAILFSRIDEIVGRRKLNAGLLVEALGGMPGISTIEVPDDAEPTFVRLPLLVDDQSARQRIVASLLKQGLGVSCSYPKSIADVPEVADHLCQPAVATQGRLVAKKIITLPTHGYVSSIDIEKIARTIREIAA